MCASFRLEQFLIPDPDDAIEEEAFSAIIVPLRQAPKLLRQVPSADRGTSFPAASCPAMSAAAA